MIFWIWATTLITVLALYFRQVYSRFRKYGIKHFDPVPVFGTISKIILRKEHVSTHVQRLYNSFPGERFVGSFEFISPVILVRDLELVKKITVKDFEHFLDHRIFIDRKTEPLFGGHLLSLKGQEWKDMRATLSPAFTSSKMRTMVPFMVEVGDQMMEAIKNKIQSSRNDYIDVDVKDLTTRYANDVIASCAFGIKVDSHLDPNNQFYVRGKQAASFTGLQFLKFFLYRAFPKLCSIVQVRVFSEATSNFFRKTIMSTMQNRTANNIIRPDMIHLLMEAKKGILLHDKTSHDVDAGFATVEESSVGKSVIKRDLSDDDLVAQAVLFYIAGYETISTTMSFLLHELALSPEVQDKLVKEIRDNDARNGGKFDYNSIQHMPYLDMIISEVLRLWPALAALDRLCTKDYNMGKPNNKATEDFILQKGEGIQIPVWAFHRNPEYFPNPDKFDPERFSEENKHKIKPFTYMPFGSGPRNCIGSRFALCEVKVMVYQLLKKIEVSPSKKTQIPIVLNPQAPQLRVKGGLWVRMKVRK